MTFSVVYWILEMMVLRSSMQVEDIIEHTNGKCHVFRFQHARGRYSQA